VTVIEPHGRINESGKLEVELPEGLPAGEVRVRIELAEGEGIPLGTDEEITELMRPKPMTGPRL
jgi:hypothetical protein